MKKLILLIILLNSYQLLYSQNFEGEIIFKIRHELSDTTLGSYEQLPQKMTYLISGDHSRLDQSTRIGIQSLVSDTLTKKSNLLFDLMDQKIGISINYEQTDSNEVRKYSYIDEEKIICGITCKKAILNSYNHKTEEAHTSVIYYTNEIRSSYSNIFKDLKGFALEYQLTTNDLKSSYSAKEINHKPIDPKNFAITKNTKIFTMEEFQSLLKK